MSNEINTNEIKPHEWINARNAFFPQIDPAREPAIDKPISEIVGKPVRTTDDRLLKLVVKYKQMKNNDDLDDNLLKNPNFIKELKEIFI